MADVELVIKLPEEVYQKIKETSMFISGKRSGKSFDYTIFNAINNGIPLTEVFEDIKAEILDLDYLVDSAKYSDSETRCHNVDYLVSEILKIIEADKAESGCGNE